MFIGRTDAEAEAPILWPPDAKNWLIGKDPDAGKDWRQEEKGTTEDETVGWHHQLNGHEFKQAPRVGDGQRSLACYSPWGLKESDTTGQLNNNYIRIYISIYKNKAFCSLKAGSGLRRLLLPPRWACSPLALEEAKENDEKWRAS